MTEIKVHGYYPGVVGKITEIHAVYYNEHWGFDVSFETQVGRELSEFISNFDEDRDGFWSATPAFSSPKSFIANRVRLKISLSSMPA